MIDGLLTSHRHLPLAEEGMTVTVYHLLCASHCASTSHQVSQITLEKWPLGLVF